MAQYTTALASDFNSIQSTLANVLGYGGGDGWGSPVNSYQVSVGQQIGHAEYAALATDINTAYNFIFGSNASLASVVQGGEITWANFVSYQNAVSSIYQYRHSAAGGVYNYNYTTLGSNTLAQGWGNASGNVRYGQSCYIQWPSYAAQQEFWNQNNSITLTMSAANSDGSSKSQDFVGMANSITVTMNNSNFYNSTYPSQSVTGTTAPYNSGSADHIDVTFANYSGTLGFSINMYDQGNDGVVASNVGVDLTINVSCRYPTLSGITNHSPTVSFQGWYAF